MSMNPQQALLAGCIDYAGTFPPAKLSLDAALQRAGQFRKDGRHPWLLSKIALPADQILSLAAPELFSHDPSGTPWVFTALGSGNRRDEVESELRDLQAWNRTGEVSPVRHLTVSYETKMFMKEAPEEQVRGIADLFSSSGLYPYFELGFENDWRERLDCISSVAAEKPALRAGIKVRTGGDAPIPRQALVESLLVCGRRRIRFKATQGLHHPVSTPTEYGFVNLFAALSLAVVSEGRAHADLIEACLLERNGKAFEFLLDRFVWRDQSVSVAELSDARAVHGGCFGSCSIDEPDQFLSDQFPER